jgi:hypothetical protein
MMQLFGLAFNYGSVYICVLCFVAGFGLSLLSDPTVLDGFGGGGAALGLKYPDNVVGDTEVAVETVFVDEFTDLCEIVVFLAGLSKYYFRLVSAAFRN